MALRWIFLLAIIVLAACGPSYSGDEEGARMLLADLRRGKVSGERLAPTSADIHAVFEDDAADAIERHYRSVKLEVTADPDETELFLRSATTDDLRNGKSEALFYFPGGYRKVAGSLRPGLTLYRWKYVRPGATKGTAYDGLVYVNRHWVWFPKPWRALER